MCFLFSTYWVIPEYNNKKNQIENRLLYFSWRICQCNKIKVWMCLCVYASFLGIRNNSKISEGFIKIYNSDIIAPKKASGPKDQEFSLRDRHVIHIYKMLLILRILNHRPKNQRLLRYDKFSSYFKLHSICLNSRLPINVKG